MSGHTRIAEREAKFWRWRDGVCHRKKSSFALAVRRKFSFFLVFFLLHDISFDVKNNKMGLIWISWTHKAYKRKGHDAWIPLLTKSVEILFRPPFITVSFLTRERERERESEREREKIEHRSYTDRVLINIHIDDGIDDVVRTFVGPCCRGEGIGRKGACDAIIYIIIIL